MKKRNRYGFTIVELLVVITIIGILAAISLMSYLQVQKKSRDVSRDSDIAVMRSELEKFYDKNGVYPPGCPAASCTPWLLTENTSAPLLSATSTVSVIQQTLPGVPAAFGDPSYAGQPPILDQTKTATQYFYYGGGIDTRTYASSASFSTPSPKKCTITSSLNPTETSSYVIGYYSEVNAKWVLQGGRRGIPLTVDSGSVADGCVINS